MSGPPKDGEPSPYFEDYPRRRHQVQAIGHDHPTQSPVADAVEVELGLLHQSGHLGAAEPTGAMRGIEPLLDASQALGFARLHAGIQLIQGVSRRGVGQVEGNGLGQTGMSRWGR